MTSYLIDDAQLKELWKSSSQELEGAIEKLKEKIRTERDSEYKKLLQEKLETIKAELEKIKKLEGLIPPGGSKPRDVISTLETVLRLMDQPIPTKA